MADKKLVSYVQDMLRRGYPANSIQQVLIQRGYTPSQANAAIQDARQLEIRHTLHLSPALLLILGAIIVAGGAFGFFALSQGNSGLQEELLDLNLEPVELDKAAGEEIVFLKEITNMGASNRYDIILKTELLDPRTGEVLTSKTETRGIETIGSSQTRLALPDSVKPGSYTLRTIAEYQGGRAVATLPVTVTAAGSLAPTCSDGIRNQDEEGIDCGGSCEACQKEETPPEGENKTPAERAPSPQELVCDDRNACTADANTDGQCSFTPITPCCGNNVCEDGEQDTCRTDCPLLQDEGENPPGLPDSQSLEELKVLASSNPRQAARGCAELTIPDHRDTCYTNTARIAKDQEYCQEISDARIKDVCLAEVARVRQQSDACVGISRDDRRDSCYLTFVLDYKDYSVCDRIINDNLRQSCFSLKNLG